MMSAGEENKNEGALSAAGSGCAAAAREPRFLASLQ
jgi:hypothetical protein